MESYELLLQRVDALMKGIDLNEKSAELPVRQLMHHLLTARVMYETMNAEERAIVDVWQKKTKKVIDVNCVLKEGKSKKRKEKPSPAPLPKEKEKKEKDEKNTHTAAGAISEVSDFFKARREAFKKECFMYNDRYPDSEIEAFYDYWSEKTKRREMMKWETIVVALIAGITCLMISVADSFDAMNSNRVYRKMLTKERIISEIENNKGRQFDPEVADVMLKLLKNGTIAMEG